MVDTPGHADFGGEVSIYFMKILVVKSFIIFSFLRYINHIEVATRISNLTITLGFKSTKF